MTGRVALGHLLSLAVLSAASIAPHLAGAETRIPSCRPLPLDVRRVEAPPSQYADFCARAPSECALTGEPVLTWSAEIEDALQYVNRQVNDEITLMSDPECLGVEEDWSLPTSGIGDCEDFALEKRHRLVAGGVPSAALTMAIVHHEVQFFPHAVLLAETTAGTWVLDNLHDRPMCWDAVPYRYERRERPDGQWDRF